MSGMTRHRLLLAGLLVLVIGIGAAVGIATLDSGGNPTVPSESETSAGAADARSARQMIALKRTAGSWPGTRGLSGVNGYPTLDTASVEEFCTARGRACNVAMTYTDRTSWSSMTSGTSWTFDNFADFDGVLVVSQGLVPAGGQADLAACAEGGHDGDFRSFGTLMKERGRADSIVRLGWEFNEQTSPWRADDTDTFLSCYRHAADSIRATNPEVLLDWTINAHNTPDGVCGGLSTDCYPGDDYVDIIGIDNYDHYPWSPTKADFETTAAEQEGLTWLYDFARARNKPFSVGEWGVTPAGDAGKENPDFVTWMHSWFAQHAEHLAYETYFSDCTASGIQSSLFTTASGCTQNPGSATRYKDLFQR
jgi:hypothetical protein